MPVGLLVGRTKGIADIRKYGSGNIGASNVLRVIGVKAGVFVWFVDALKGFIPVAVGMYLLGLTGWSLAFVAVAAMSGHCFSPYLRLTGGRGVSTSLGVIIGLDWRVGVICFLFWILIVAITRYISLGSMLAASSSVPLLWVLEAKTPYIAGAGTIALIVLIRHIPNIQRLLSGTERKIGQKEPLTSQPADPSAVAGDETP